MAHRDDDGVGFDMIGTITTDKQQQKQDEEIQQFEALLKKKKKKKKRKKKKKTLNKNNTTSTNDIKSANNDNNVANNNNNNVASADDNLLLNSNYFSQTDKRDYPYTVLLDRIFNSLHQNNPNLMKKGTYKLEPPQTALHGTKKTGWGNFKKICNKLNRSLDHVKSFFLTEMNTTGNLDAQNSFIIKGRWKTKQVESLLKKYIKEYVTCGNCRSPKTVMKKDNATRLYFLTCSDCGASRSVAPIKAGFHATTRDERRAARNAKK